MTSYPARGPLETGYAEGFADKHEPYFERKQERINPEKQERAAQKLQQTVEEEEPSTTELYREQRWKNILGNCTQKR